MSPKSSKSARPKSPAAKSRPGDRWTVRGVPAHLQKAAAEAAWAADLTMGAWLSRLIEEAVAANQPPSDPSTLERLATIEQRLEELERALPVTPA